MNVAIVQEQPYALKMGVNELTDDECRIRCAKGYSDICDKQD